MIATVQKFLGGTTTVPNFNLWIGTPGDAKGTRMLAAGWLALTNGKRLQLIISLAVLPATKPI